MGDLAIIELTQCIALHYPACPNGTPNRSDIRIDTRNPGEQPIGLPEVKARINEQTHQLLIDPPHHRVGRAPHDAVKTGRISLEGPKRPLYGNLFGKLFPLGPELEFPRRIAVIFTRLEIGYDYNFDRNRLDGRHYWNG